MITSNPSDLTGRTDMAVGGTDALVRAFALIDRLVEGPVRGAALAVAQGGVVLGEHYAGDARPGVRSSAETLWPLASISKLYTAAAAMALIERGELTLSTRVATVFPNFTTDGRDQISLRHLLTHTSGLPYESPQMPELLSAQTPLDEMVDEAFQGELRFRPGASQLYSDPGYALAGRMIAAVTGMPLSEVVRRLVLEPAGFAETFFPPTPREDERIAYIDGPFAEGTDGAMYNSRYARDLAHPAFGVVSTVTDLLRFGMLFTASDPRRFLSRAGLMTMTTDQTGGDLPGEVVEPVTGLVHPWGIGFMLKGRAGYPELVSPESYGHGGASGCYLWIDPRFDIVAAFVSNRHINLDFDEFFVRLERVLSVTMASLTRED